MSIEYLLKIGFISTKTELTNKLISFSEIPLGMKINAFRLNENIKFVLVINSMDYTPYTKCKVDKIKFWKKDIKLIFKGCFAYFYVFDLFDKISFENIKKLVRYKLPNAFQPIKEKIRYLIGIQSENTSLDLKDFQDFANEYDIKFITLPNKMLIENTNFFNEVAKEIISKMKQGNN